MDWVAATIAVLSTVLACGALLQKQRDLGRRISQLDADMTALRLPERLASLEVGKASADHRNETTDDRLDRLEEKFGAHQVDTSTRLARIEGQNQMILDRLNQALR